MKTYYVVSSTEANFRPEKFGSKQVAIAHLREVVKRMASIYTSERGYVLRTTFDKNHNPESYEFVKLGQSYRISAGIHKISQ